MFILIQEQILTRVLLNKFLPKRQENMRGIPKKCKQFFPASKIQMTGNPVRKVIPMWRLSASSVLSILTIFDKPTVLVLGGSHMLNHQ